jgi:hypothetical protein
MVNNANSCCSAGHANNPFFLSIREFHGRFIKTFDSLPQNGKVKEIVIRIIIVATSIIAYPFFGVIALIGMPFSPCFYPPSPPETSEKLVVKKKAVNEKPILEIPKLKKRPSIEISRRNSNFNNISVSCCSSRHIGQEIQDKIGQKEFCSDVNELFGDGLFESFEKQTNISLKFIPENHMSINQKLRIQLAAQALTLATKQPENRPFEYVGFGSGFMRQDMHQILGLLSKDLLQVNNLRISLIDPIYSPSSPDYDEHSMDCLVEFAAILHLRAPHAKIMIGLYASADELIQNKNPEIDLVVGIRVENESKNKELCADLKKLYERLADNSGCFISDTTAQNKVQSIHKRNGIVIDEMTSQKERTGVLGLYANGIHFLSARSAKRKKIGC